MKSEIIRFKVRDKESEAAMLARLDELIAEGYEVVSEGQKIDGTVTYGYMVLTVPAAKRIRIRKTGEYPPINTPATDI